MLGIIGLVLKIILFIILGLIGLIILLLCLVLFVPIKYLVNVEKEDELKVKGRISWLLGLVRVYFDVEDSTSYHVKVLFFKVKSSEMDAKKAKAKEETEATQEKSEEAKTNEDKESKSEYEKNRTVQSSVRNIKKVVIKTETTNQADESIEEETKEVQANEEEKTDEKKAETVTETDKITKMPKDNYSKKDKPKKDKSKKDKPKKDKPKKDKSKKDKSDKGSIIERIKGLYNKVKPLWQDDRYNGVIRYVLGNVFKILKSIRPRKLWANVVFGTGDPATTGYIVGGVSMFYGFGNGRIVVTPDFMEKTFFGTIRGKGRVFLFVLLYYGIRTYLDKRVRLVMKIFS